MSMIIRNQKRNSVILPMQDRTITLMPAGDPSGADVAHVDDDVARAAMVQEAVRRGLVTVVTAEDEVKAALERQDDLAHREQDDLAASASAVIERRQDRSLVGHSCIGPGVRDALTCQATVIRSSAVAAGDAPPLCEKHQHLSHEYYQTEVQVERTDGSDVGPVTSTVWKRMAMTSPSRNLA